MSAPSAAPRWRGPLLGLLALIGLNLGIQAPRLVSGQAPLSLQGEVWLLAVLLGWAATTGRGRSGIRIGFATALCGILLIYEGIQQVGAMTMGQEPLLYDALALSRHLFILGMDLYGSGIYYYLAMGGLLGVAAILMMAWMIYWVEQGISAASREGIGLALGVLLLGLLPPVPMSWGLAGLGANLWESGAHWRSLRAQVHSNAYAGYREINLTDPADLRIYTVESYGAILGTEARTAERWAQALKEMEERLHEGGWHTASALSTAPVVGGRSWLADATLWLGIPVAHQSTYQHLFPRIDQLDHLPRFLKQQGYQTVLIKPKDRERPGVKLDNSFGFHHTVFFKDLRWIGRRYGWGIIPDQYTIGFVEEEILARLPPPRFAFFHLVSSHVPWREPPPISENWRLLSALQDAPQVRLRDRPRQKQVQFELKRYQRAEGPRSRTVRAADLDAYEAVVHYTLQSLVHELAQAPEVPTLMLWMGDHQPPMLISDIHDAPHALDVPIHAIANDPRLLEALIAQGFRPGMLPQIGSEAPLRHEALFSLLVRALTVADGQPAPPYYPLGTAGPPE